MNLDQSREDVQHQIKSSILDAKHITKVGSWSVQTLYQSGKLAQVIREFKNYKLDILGLSEVRWTGSIGLNEKKYKPVILWT